MQRVIFIFLMAYIIVTCALMVNYQNNHTDREKAIEAMHLQRKAIESLLHMYFYDWSKTC